MQFQVELGRKITSKNTLHNITKYKSTHALISQLVSSNQNSCFPSLQSPCQAISMLLETLKAAAFSQNNPYFSFSWHLTSLRGKRT